MQAAVAPVIPQRFSIGPLFEGGKVAMFFGGNTVSSLTDFGASSDWKRPRAIVPRSNCSNGPALVSQNSLVQAVCEEPSFADSFKAATGSSSSPALGVEATLQGGITAGEYTSGVALAKFAYDVGSFAYGYFLAGAD